MKYVYTACIKCRAIGRDNRGDNFASYDDGSGHCYSCGHHVFPTHYLQKVKEVDHESNVLPAGFSREIPARAWKWLFQYGLPYSHWEDKVGWDEKHSRLVFAVPNIRSVAFSQGRYIGSSEAEPNAGRLPPKWFNMGNSHSTPYVVGNYTSPEAKCLVLVEDWISANKVSSSGTPCISLFGTRVWDSCISFLRYVGLPVVLWLDNDQRGTVERKAANVSMLTGLPTRVVYSDCDPKLLSFDVIKEKLCLSEKA